MNMVYGEVYMAITYHRYWVVFIVVVWMDLILDVVAFIGEMQLHLHKRFFVRISRMYLIIKLPKILWEYKIPLVTP